MKITASKNNNTNKAITIMAMLTLATTTATTDVTTNEPLVLDRDLLNIWEMSRELGNATYSTSKDNNIEEVKERLGLDQLEMFQDVRNNAIVSSNLVAKHNNICYGAFRGTQWQFRQDWSQVFDTAPEQVGDCFVHRGLNENYVLADKPGFDAALKSCLNSCNSNDCELVLTGDSQGGGTAISAQLYWTDYDPLVVTYGAPAVLYTPNCTAINSNKNHRFWNSESIAGTLTYDVISNLNSLGTHYGHALLMSADQPVPVYLGLDDNSKRNVYGLRAHFGYQVRIEALVDQADTLDLPIRLDEAKLAQGSSCGDNDECQSGRCDNFRSCAAELDGDFCRKILAGRNMACVQIDQNEPENDGSHIEEVVHSVTSTALANRCCNGYCKPLLVSYFTLILAVLLL